MSKLKGALALIAAAAFTSTVALAEEVKGQDAEAEKGAEMMKHEDGHHHESTDSQTKETK